MRPIAVPEPPQRPRSVGRWLLVVGVLGAVGASAWLLTQYGSGGMGPVATGLRTVVAEEGTLRHTIRVGGTLSARRFSAIRAPRLNGPRDAGRSSLVLMDLVQGGSYVKAGDEVARFELRWLEDHIDDVRSRLAQTEASAERVRSQVLLARETERRDATNARAELDKAKLDLRTAPVRSDIEAQILELAVQEATVQAEQLGSEYELQGVAHEAELEVARLGVREEEVHLGRHVGDLAEMSMRTRVGGLVVMESIYKGGAFGQVQTGDTVYPGALFMRVVDLSEMQLEASVSQTDVQKLRIGQRCMVRVDAYGDMELNGRVHQIGAIAGSGGSGKFRFRRGGSTSFVRSIPVIISILDADERVIPDLSASADVVVSDDDEGIVVPREAVVSNGDQGMVVVRIDNRTERRAVKLGPQNDTHVIVRSGLEAGEEVLLSEQTGTEDSPSGD